MIHRFWKHAYRIHCYRLQGPAVNDLRIAVNDTELYSLEPTDTIPPIYRYSFYDDQKSIWMFDIRTLAYSLAKGSPQQNPYTRAPLNARTLTRLHTRIAWLRDRKYQILHTNTDVLTPEQMWNQHVLDYFLKIEALGYYVSSDWFHQMRVSDHVLFYEQLRELWEWKLALTNADKERIVPGGVLFRHVARSYLHKPIQWWQNLNIEFIEKLVTGSTDREQQKLGALYILMALVRVSSAAAEALPWITDIIQTN